MQYEDRRTKMKQWGRCNVLPGQVVVLLVDKNVDIVGTEEEIRKQLTQNGRLIVAEHNKCRTLPEIITSSSVDAVISYVDDTSLHDDALLACIITFLKPGGFLILYESLQGRTADASQKLARRLMFSGFIDIQINAAGDFVETSSTKPDWEIGASQKIETTQKPNVTNPTKNIWAMPPSIDSEDLIDEDLLLDESDRIFKPSTKRDDCDGGKRGRKACKNCTCGRADVVDDGTPRKKLTLEMLENPGINSSCGSCGLGDAFRCAGCPYRGLPAFKVGEKITLPDSFLEDDTLM
jgi:hypothetical protein